MADVQNILILDLSGTGHHPRYIRWVLESEACRESVVTVAGPRELLEHAELTELSGRFRGHEVVVSAKSKEIIADVSSSVALMRRQFAVWEIWRKVYREVTGDSRLDLAILPWVDDCLEAIGLRGSPFGDTHWTGIALRAMFHFKDVGVQAPAPRFSSARQWLFRRVLREKHLRGLFTIDPTLVEYAESHFTEHERGRLLFLPDPAVEHIVRPRNDARKELEIPFDVKVVLAYGALSERKGIGPLIEAAADHRCPNNLHVILAGKQSQDIRPILVGTSATQLLQQKRLHILDEYQTDAEEARLLAASDCVWVGYRGFYTMSGILLLAARHGIPCVVSDIGIGGYFARKHHFGLLVDTGNGSSVLQALQSVSNDENGLADAGRNAKRVFKGHTLANFQKALSSLIRGANAHGGRTWV